MKPGVFKHQIHHAVDFRDYGFDAVGPPGSPVPSGQVVHHQ